MRRPGLRVFDEREGAKQFHTHACMRPRERDAQFIHKCKRASMRCVSLYVSARVCVRVCAVVWCVGSYDCSGLHIYTHAMRPINRCVFLSRHRQRVFALCARALARACVFVCICTLVRAMWK